MLSQSLVALITMALTEFPLRTLVVETCMLAWLPLHLLETLDCLRDATTPFKNITNRPINVKHCKLELNRKRVDIQNQIIM